MVRSTKNPSDGATPPSRISRVRKKNLSLTEKSLSTIEELRMTTDAATDAEIVRRALAFYVRAVRSEKEGGRILYQDRDGNNALVFAS